VLVGASVKPAETEVAVGYEGVLAARLGEHQRLGELLSLPWE
jgi:hypothetical protein